MSSAQRGMYELQCLLCCVCMSESLDLLSSMHSAAPSLGFHHCVTHAWVPDIRVIWHGVLPDTWHLACYFMVQSLLAACPI